MIAVQNHKKKKNLKKILSLRFLYFNYNSPFLSQSPVLPHLKLTATSEHKPLNLQEILKNASFLKKPSLPLQFPWWFIRFWYPHSPQEQLGMDCLSSPAWRWTSSNTHMCPNRTQLVLAERALGISAWSCQGLETSWQFSNQRTQSVCWTLSLLIYQGHLWHPQIVLKVFNSLLYSLIPYLPVNWKNISLSLANSLSILMSGRDGDSNTAQAVE